MRLVTVLIRRSPMMSVPKVVGEHEVPVLKAVHGDGAIQVEGDAGEYEVEDAASEYERLALVYGVHVDRKQSYVEIVYGRGPAQLAAALGTGGKRKAS